MEDATQEIVKRLSLATAGLKFKSELYFVQVQNVLESAVSEGLISKESDIDDTGRIYLKLPGVVRDCRIDVSFSRGK